MNEHKLGVVAIGRNEGERLRRCLSSVLPLVPAAIYVDSGSNDGSKQMATEMGAEVVELDMSRPFTAARARNEGLRRLLLQHPAVDFVQFVDGDCEIVAGWLESAREFLNEHPSHAVVCGRRREQHPERSVYNLMCDREWNTPVGDTVSCGGDAMMRATVVQTVGGYRDSPLAALIGDVQGPQVHDQLVPAGTIEQNLSLGLERIKVLHFCNVGDKKRAGH